MRTYPECFPCFLNQAIDTSRLITRDEIKLREILTELCSSIPLFPEDATPSEIGRDIYRIIFEKTGIDNPYRKIKKQFIKKALSLYPELKEKVTISKDRLGTAIRLSIAGNVIDFGSRARFNLEKDIEKILHQEFAFHHYREFKDVLKKAEKILYLADNAGETVFDRILIEELKRPVYYAVKEKPIINDATEEDAFLSGLDKIAQIVSTGSDAPGAILKFCSEQFLQTYRASDLIISKGQGNYEGLSEEARPIFFLLKAKCLPVARDIGIKEGDIILMKAKNWTAQ